MKAQPLPSRRQTNASSLQNNHRSGSTRESVYWRATYTYKSNGFTYTDEAWIRDVSATGCGVCGRTTLAEGTKLTLTLYLVDQLPPLSVAGVWGGVAGDFFGVKFLGLSEDKYRRMQRHMQVMLGESTPETETVSFIKKFNTAGIGFAAVVVLLGALSGC